MTIVNIAGGMDDIIDAARSLNHGDVLRVSANYFDRAELRKWMSEEGLILLRPWKSECGEGLEGTRPFVSELKVSAAMSVPRLGYMANFGCALDALVPLGIKLRREGGAFWGQALQNCLEIILDEDKPDAILTLDYDSVFTIANVAYLIQLMMCHPEADAVAPIQSSRHLPTALFTKKDKNGEQIGMLNTEFLEPDFLDVETAHFGLTLIRADKLASLPKPWFIHVPAPDGTWERDSGKIDEDINFWVKWRKAGNTLFLANRVAIGHLEETIRWPGQDLQAVYQSVRDFLDNGTPDEAWK